MFVLRLVLKNARRHRLRTLLTVAGIAIAVMSFGLMRTVVTAWYAGVEASAANRMITRHSVSFIFPLPLAYRDQIATIPGVERVTFANWFGGTYKDTKDWKNFFPRIGIDADAFFDVYPEYQVSAEDLAAFRRERNACIIGAKLAREQNFKRGDLIPVEGDIFPGHWEFVVRGIYTGRDATVDETQMFFQWKYLDEMVAQTQPGRDGHVGWYVLQVDMPRVAKTVDDRYLNSMAGTKTETEREFQQSFVSMSSAILTSMETISYVIIGIILLVLANTIVMSARERTREYAVLKTLGFSPAHIAGLIGGESLLIALTGGAVGLGLTFPAAGAFAKAFPTFFPIFTVQPVTIAFAIAAVTTTAVAAALFPTLRALRSRIADGLRAVG
jgi:putative ABC transport system permease protein